MRCFSFTQHQYNTYSHYIPLFRIVQLDNVLIRDKSHKTPWARNFTKFSKFKCFLKNNFKKHRHIPSQIPVVESLEKKTKLKNVLEI